MIARGAITQRATAERLPAQTIERDYVLAHLCAEIGAGDDARLVFKGGTLLRLCHFREYRHSADLDFSAVGGLSRTAAQDIVGDAAAACRERVEFPTLELTDRDGGSAWVAYVGPLGSRPRRIKVDISDDEVVESHRRLPMHLRWPDLPDSPAIEGYTLDEVAAEKLRCIAERLQCRDLYDLQMLLDSGDAAPLEVWELYLRKARNDVGRSRATTPPGEWAAVFERRLAVYRDRWDAELGEYLAVDVPAYAEVERRIRRQLAPVVAAARALAT